jgi:HlyD family secretion protein
MKAVKTISRPALWLVLCPVLCFTACREDASGYDATGTFEADQVIVSSQAAGMLERFDVQEGERLDSGQVIGYVDSTQLHLKKEQLQAQVTSVLSGRPDVATQVAAIQAQLDHAEQEQRRMANLVQGDAAPAKQLDDANALVAVLRRQLAAQHSALAVTSHSIESRTLPLQIQIRELNDLLNKCRIVNPVKGTVVTRYALAHEMTAAGRPLYTIADLSSLSLRAYITADQFSTLRLGQKVKVRVDGTAGSSRTYEGTVRWISDKAEFTPRTIQTRNERANLVYAIKVSVPNDGTLKIGMYGEVNL